MASHLPLRKGSAIFKNMRFIVCCVGFDEQVIAIYSPNDAKNGIKRGIDSMKGAAEQRSQEANTGLDGLSAAACVGPVVTQLLCYRYMMETM